VVCFSVRLGCMGTPEENCCPLSYALQVRHAKPPHLPRPFASLAKSPDLLDPGFLIV
jgi:hypothetical protein